MLRNPRLWLCIMLCLSTNFLVGCQQRDSSTPALTEKASWEALYLETLALFDERRPGFGLDTYVSDAPHDYSMAYALYASAEARRFLATRDPVAFENAIRAAEWLIDHRAQAGDGDVGWGLPWPWDAFGDSTTNPAHTVYGITTALGIEALLDVFDACGCAQTANKGQICAHLVETAIQAAETFLDGCFDYYEDSDELVFWYSHLPEDSYHVLNVTSMLVGQLQRLSRYVESQEKRTVLELTAERGARYILNRMNVDEQGNPYWHYLGDRRPPDALVRPNDLVHESYTIHGLVNYAIYGGRLATRIDLFRLLLSLNRFLNDDNRAYEFPRNWDPGPDGEELRHQPARLWGVGYALFVSAYIEDYLGLSPSLSARFLYALRPYWSGQGWSFRPGEASLFYPRQVAHVLAGLSSLLFPTVKAPECGEGDWK